MKISFVYNFKKIVNKIEMFLIRKKMILNNLLFVNSTCGEINTILLYFPDYEMMHFGDHLFFEPLARYLKLNNFEVLVSPIPAMEFYFEELGYPIFNNHTFENVDLIVTKVEFLNRFRGSQNQILFVDTASSKIRLPLCHDLIEKIAHILGLPKINYDPVPSYFDNYKEDAGFSLDKEKRYIIFNNYIDSGQVRSGTAHQNLIISFVTELKKKTGFDVIHTGSAKDKNNDTGKYNFVDIDLRGNTTIKGLFRLCANKSVVYNVSFDGFQMHLFFIKNKKSFILFRGRFLKKNEKYIKNFVNPPFYHPNPTSLIEYIE